MTNIRNQETKEEFLLDITSNSTFSPLQSTECIFRKISQDSANLRYIPRTFLKEGVTLFRIKCSPINMKNIFQLPVHFNILPSCQRNAPIYCKLYMGNYVILNILENVSPIKENTSTQITIITMITSCNRSCQ